MFNKVFTVILMAFVVFSLSAFAAGSKVAKHHAKVVTPEMEAAWEDGIQAHGVSRHHNPVLDDFSAPIGETVYDYATNNITARMLARAASGNVHIAFMKRFPNSAADRFVTYNYADIASMVLFGEQSVTEDQATGWGRVVNGRDDEALVSFHGGGAWLYGDVAESGYSFSNKLTSATNILAANFPGFARNGDVIYYSCSSDAGGSFTPDAFLVSTDYGATFTQATFPSTSFVTGGIAGNAESWPNYNPADGSVNMVMVEEDPNNATVTPGALSWAVSSDEGASWTTTALVTESDEFTYGSGDTYTYLVQNFSQFNSDIADDGTMHIVFNGYGTKVAAGTTDTTFIFPVVYWNSADNALVELTDPMFSETITTDLSDAIAAGFPGNGIGNSYPTVGFASNGAVVVLWQQVELDAANMPVVALVDSTATANGAGLYATDIWGAVSEDGGTTWGSPFYVTGEAGYSETFPVLARSVQLGGGSGEYLLDFCYYDDSDPGVSLFSEGTASIGEWVYVNQTVVTSIDDRTATVADGYALKQNYPNPFNPSTNIEFSLKAASDVSLEVFNLLGEKVATVVSERMNAGDHSVNFDAGSLTSGVYFYKLNTDNFSATRKMVLMK